MQGPATPAESYAFTISHPAVATVLTGTGTRLTLRHTVEDRQWVPKVAAGWHLCLDVAEHLLDGDPVGPIRGADARNYGWDELNEAYAAKLGLDVSSA